MNAPTGRKAKVIVIVSASCASDFPNSLPIAVNAKTTRKKSNASSGQPRKLARTAERWPRGAMLATDSRSRASALVMSKMYAAYSCCMKSQLRLAAVALALVCAPALRTAPPINTVETAIAPDAVADTLLTDVRTLDSTIVVDLRYATANNFTGAPLPGYLANRAFLRREAAAALARVQSDLKSQGLGLKMFDAY